MKILIDENVNYKVKEGLIKLGIDDVLHVNDVNKGITDIEVFNLALKENRIIITGDDDFKSKDFKYKTPIIWITPKARYIEEKLPFLIKWILNNLTKYNINIKKAFITIRKNEYFVEYKNKDGIFGKIKYKKISYNAVK